MDPMDLGFRMHAERTPNPNSIKWVLGSALTPPGVSAHFDHRPSPEVSPLAARLFDLDGVEGSLAAGGEALGPAFEALEQAGGDELVQRIRRILEDEVRPAVAMDGGDIVFAGYREGVVEVYMHGSCSGCPSSTATLRLGIEARLREEIPEVQEVVAL